mmetsp:Transcript_25657/g.28545  ORF Transcript_25657/g.28545 Transcript_25657/m.28545 type:complete len:384 (-) Transcript_25657:407-1558(-)
MATLRSKFHKVEDLQHSGNISHVQQYVNYARYALTHTKDSLGEAMIKEHLYKDDLPLYVVNLEDVKQKQYQWAEHLPKITAHYAVKCNPDPHICEELAKLGCGFDCASQAEMELIISLGVDPGRIIYAHPCKPYSHLKRAQELGVDMMVFDSKYELEKIQAIHPEAKLLLRLAVDNSYSLHPLSNKFGVRFKHVPELLEYAFSLNLNVIGVSFHVGSKVTDPKAFTIALQEVRKVFDMAEKYGFEEFTLLDIGGGFPGNWEGEATTLPEIAVGLNKIIPQVFPKAYSKVRVIAEPGRYMVSSCASVITTVIGKREETLASGEHKMIYYLNEGLYGCFNNIIFDDKTPKPHLLHQPTGIALHTILQPYTISTDNIKKKNRHAIL